MLVTLNPTFVASHCCVLDRAAPLNERTFRLPTTNFFIVSFSNSTFQRESNSPVLPNGLRALGFETALRLYYAWSDNGSFLLICFSKVDCRLLLFSPNLTEEFTLTEACLSMSLYFVLIINLSGTGMISVAILPGSWFSEWSSFFRAFAAKLSSFVMTR